MRTPKALGGRQGQADGKRAWYRLAVNPRGEASQATEADIWIYDQIGLDFWTGEGVTAKQFVDELNALPGAIAQIRLHMNCPGGSVFDAVAIANALKNHKASVEVRIEALAASAATIITMAGDRIVIADNALMMIHNPMTIAWGTAAEIRQAAEMLDAVADSVLATYAWHATKSREELLAMMEATTWMDAEEAVANGFATEIGETMKAAAHFDARALAKLGPVPQKYQAQLDAMRAAAEEERKPGDAETEDPPAGDPPAAEPAKTDPPTASNVVSITATRDRQIRDEEMTRVEAINRTFAAMARSHPALAVPIEELRKTAVSNRLSIEAAARSIVDLLEQQSGDQVENRVSPIPAKPTATIDTQAIYAKLNAIKRRK